MRTLLCIDAPRTCFFAKYPCMLGSIVEILAQALCNSTMISIYPSADITAAQKVRAHFQLYSISIY